MTDREQGFRIATREREWLTGISITGPFEIADSETARAWETLVAREASLPAVLRRDEWLSAGHTRETEFTCYVGMTSPVAVDDVPAGLVSIVLRPHDYLVAHHRGTRDELGNLYAAMFSWLQRHERELNREILWLERYTAPSPSERDLDVEIWLPLR